LVGWRAGGNDFAGGERRPAVDDRPRLAHGADGSRRETAGLGNRPTNGQSITRRLPSTSANDSPLRAFGFDRLNHMNLLPRALRRGQICLTRRPVEPTRRTLDSRLNTSRTSVET